jgi:hypothetical protein
MSFKLGFRGRFWILWNPNQILCILAKNHRYEIYPHPAIIGSFFLWKRK